MSKHKRSWPPPSPAGAIPEPLQLTRVQVFVSRAPHMGRTWVGNPTHFRAGDSRANNAFEIRQVAWVVYASAREVRAGQIALVRTAHLGSAPFRMALDAFKLVKFEPERSRPLRSAPVIFVLV